MPDIRNSLEDALLSAIERRDASEDLKEFSSQVSRFSDNASSIGVERLLQLVQRELVPRLLMAHKSDPITAVAPANQMDEAPKKSLHDNDTVSFGNASFSWGEEDFRFLGDLCVLGDAVGIRRVVGSFMDRGASLERIYLDFISPTARWLGDRWVDDSLSFVDVHLGLVQLHQLVAYYEAAELKHIASREHKIMLACTPGDQHTFGITLVSDFFRRAGWQVSNRSGQTLDQLSAHVANSQFSCIGLSLHCDAQIPALNRCISHLRKRSANSEALFIVGGNYFLNHTLVRCPIEADLCLIDAGEAVERVSALVESRSRSETHCNGSVHQKESADEKN